MARGKGGGKRRGWSGRGRGGKGKGKKRKRHARDIGEEDDEEPAKGNGKGKARRKGKDPEAPKPVTEDPTDEAEPPPIRKSVRPGYDKLLQAFGVGGGDSGTTSESDSSDEEAEGEESGDENSEDAGMLEPESEQLTRNSQAENDAEEEKEEEEQDDGEEEEQIEEDDEDANNVNADASESHEGSNNLDFYPNFWDDLPRLLPPKRAKLTGAFAVPGLSRCEARKCDVATLLPYLRSASEAAGVWKRCGLAPGLQRKFEQFLSKDGFEVTPCIGSLFLFLHAYLDVSFPQHTHLNSRAVRAVCMLHAVDHVLKVSHEVFTNTEAVKNDSGPSSGTEGKGAKAAANEEHPLADQGFTRARILVLCPFRSACYEMVNMFLACCPSAKLVVNKKRFEDEFGAGEGDGQAHCKKPADYRHLFSGNTDDRFHVGLAVRRKSVRLYSPFKNSDVLFCSPLGLRQITGAEGEKNRDYDFLSSIEVCIVDRADVLRMQNWEHLEEVLQVVNRRPQSVEGIDISRLRPAFAAGNARAFRQTVVTSAGQSMDASSLFTKSSSSGGGGGAPHKAPSSLARKLCFGGGSDNEDEGDADACLRTGLVAEADACPSQSCRGLVCLVGPPEGAPLQHTRALGVARQFFLHAPCGPLAEQADQLFKVFESRYWKPLGASLEHLLIVATTYFSFLRLRQYFREESASFCSVYEYSKSGDLGKARTKFVQGERRVLLVTERFLWYRRYHLKGVDYVLFYGPPETPEIYEDVLNAVRTPSECNSMCLFTRHDAFALERIVGHERAVRMLAAPPGKVFVYS